MSSGAPPARGTRCCTPWGRATGHPAGHRVLPARVFCLLPTVQHGCAHGQKCFSLFSLSTFSPVHLRTLVLVPALFHLPKFCDSLPGPFPRFSHVSKPSSSECCSLRLLPVFSSPSANCHLSFPHFNNQPLQGCLPLAVTFCPAPSALPEAHFSVQRAGSGIHLLPAALCTASVRFQ